MEILIVVGFVAFIVWVIKEWAFYTRMDGQIKRIVEDITTNWDGDKEVEIWTPSRGQNGVASSISALVHDAEWKLEQLESLLSDLQRGKVA